MTDLQARLDRAITKARDTVLCAPLWPAVDRLSALVALRARLMALDMNGIYGNAAVSGEVNTRYASTEAEAERLMEDA